MKIHLAQLALSTEGCSCIMRDGSWICCHGDSCSHAMAERHRQFWHVSSWLVEEGRCDSVYDLSLWLMTSIAAAGWQWAAGWLPWQHSNNLVAKASSPGMHMKAFGQAARPPPTTPQPAGLLLSSSIFQPDRITAKGRRQKWWKRSINIPEIPSGSAPWHVWRWMGHDAWRPAESRRPWSLIWSSTL